MKNQLPNNNSTKGFTLIELLITIAIIAILATIALVIFGSTQGRSRDAKRQQDVNAVAKALEVAKSAANSATYPALAVAMFANGSVPTDPNIAQIYCAAAGATLPTAPSNATTWGLTCPTTSVAYASLTAASGANTITNAAGFATFRVCAFLETPTTNNVYCVTNQQ